MSSGSEWMLVSTHVRDIKVLRDECHKLDMDAETFKARMDEQAVELRKYKIKASKKVIEWTLDEKITRIAQLEALLERVSTYPAGSWMSAALSEEDTATCDECKRDFQAWFDFLDEISTVLKEDVDNSDDGAITNK